MISFVWSSRYPFIAGSGGSETYTAGQVRELNRRCIDARIIVIGHSIRQSLKDFPDIEFLKLDSKEPLAELDDTIVFVMYGLEVKTKHPSYVILHIPPPSHAQPDSQFNLKALNYRGLMAPSKYSAKIWSRYYAKMSRKIPLISIVHPFANPIFSEVERPAYRGKKVRLLFAGRLHPEKGIYTLLAALQLHPMKELNYSLTVTTAGSNTEEGRVIKKMLEVHPRVNLIPAVKGSQGMAKLMAKHDIALMPTTNIFWRESFGIVSVEAQHAGCRVIASKSGGLSETDCGGLIKVEADNPMALAKTIVKTAQLGALTDKERARAINKFTVEESVNRLLATIKYVSVPKTKQPQKAKAPLQLFHHSRLNLNRASSKQQVP